MSALGFEGLECQSNYLGQLSSGGQPDILLGQKPIKDIRLDRG
jgi:hypothetical protein